MFIPQRTNFDRAVNPKIILKNRLKVTDPGLKDGEVCTYRFETIKGDVIIDPLAYEGGFAIVYKFQKGDGTWCAMRCFKNELDQDMQWRYERIGQYFAQHASQVTAKFSFHNPGIEVRGDNPSDKRILPILVMDWVEGDTLLEYVDKLAQRKDTHGLSDLVNRWRQIVGLMRRAKIAHGDLAGNNIKVRPDGSLILVDYDGVYIPDFKGKTPIAWGTADYQHHELKRPFDENFDSFSALAIFTALVALRERPDLWAPPFIARKKDGALENENLLFTVKDYQQPDHSELFKRLRAISQPDVKQAVAALEDACRKPSNQTRLPTWLDDPDQDKKEALNRFKGVLLSKDFKKILAGWVPLLESFADAQPFQKIVDEARKMQTALSEFERAQSSNNDTRILEIFRKFESQFKDTANLLSPLTPDQYKRINQAERNEEAINAFQKQRTQTDDERILVRVYNQYKATLDQHPQFSAQDKSLMAMAGKRVAMFERLKTMLATDLDEEIATAYDEAVRPLPWMWRELDKQFPGSEKRVQVARAHLKKIQDFKAAATTNDHRQMNETLSQLGYIPVLKQAKLNAADKAILDGALKRYYACLAFRKVIYASQEIAQQDDESIVKIYDDHGTVLDGSALIFPGERKQLDEARMRVKERQELSQAIKANDDEAIVAAEKKLVERTRKRLAEADRVAIQQAHARLAAFALLRQALDAIPANDDLVAERYVDLLRNYPKLTLVERERCEHIREAHDHVNLFLKAVKDDSDTDIVRLYRPEFDTDPHITQAQRNRVNEARARLEEFGRYRDAAKRKDDAVIISLFPRLRQYLRLKTKDDEEIYQRALKRRAAMEIFRAARQTNDDRKICDADNPILNECLDYSQEDRDALQSAITRLQMFNALIKALPTGDDDAITKSYRKDQIREWMAFAPDQLQRFEQATRNVEALDKLKEALDAGQDDIIVNVFDQHASILSGLPKAQMHLPRVELARRRMAALRQLEEAIKTGDEREIVKRYDPILDGYDKLSKAWCDKVHEARQCVEMPDRIRKALKARDDRAVKKAYQEKLVRPWSKAEIDQMMPEIKFAGDRAQQFDQLVNIIHADDDDKIIDTYRPYIDDFKEMTPEIKVRVNLAHKRRDTRQKMFEVAKGNDDEVLLAACDYTILGDLSKDAKLPAAVRDRFALAHVCVPALKKLQLLVSQGNHDDEALALAWTPELDRYPLMRYPQATPGLVERARMAVQRVNALKVLRGAFASKDDQRIARTGDELIATGFDMNTLSSLDKQQLTLARARQKMIREVFDALKTDNDELIAKAYDRKLLPLLGDPLAQHQKRINLALKRDEDAKQIRDALDARDMQRALEIERRSGLLIPDERWNQQKQRFIQSLSPRNVGAWITHGELRVSWDWPDLVEQACVVWRRDDFPTSPDDPSATRCFISRGEYRAKDAWSVPVNDLRKAFVCVYNVVKAVVGRNEIDFFSDGLERTSRSMGRPPIAIQCLLKSKSRLKEIILHWLKKKPSSKENVLLIATEDGTPLPDLVIVRKERSLPLGKWDGIVVDDYESAYSACKIDVPFSIATWPAHSLIQVFATRDADTNYCDIGLVNNARTEVN